MPEQELARINIKIPLELHRRLRLYSVASGQTLANVIASAVERLLTTVPAHPGEQVSPPVNDPEWRPR
jgi:hypothetical protein